MMFSSDCKLVDIASSFAWNLVPIGSRFADAGRMSSSRTS
jgi:hypothetical protein